MTAHPNAAILRGMAEGRQVVTRDAHYAPLQNAPSAGLQQLLQPSDLVNPGRWGFSFADELETA